jgi:hypothetical protein
MVETVAIVSASVFYCCAGSLGPQPLPQSVLALDHLDPAIKPTTLPTARPTIPNAHVTRSAAKKNLGSFLAIRRNGIPRGHLSCVRSDRLELCIIPDGLSR